MKERFDAFIYRNPLVVLLVIMKMTLRASAALHLLALSLSSVVPSDALNTMMREKIKRRRQECEFRSIMR